MPNSIEQLVGQLIIAGFRGKSAKSDSDIARYIRDYHLSGVILYDEDLELDENGSRNISSQEQVLALTKQLQSCSDDGLLVSIDQEGGSVARLKPDYGFPEFPSWNHIGVLDSGLMTKQFANSISDSLKKCGINLNLAPVLDLDYGAETIIGKSNRAISLEPTKVIEHAEIFIRALKKKNIISCGKHFPGQGSASGDTHEGFTDISASWTVADLIPFDDLIQSGDLDMIMMAHVFNEKLDPALPASLSREIVTGVLRKDLGFLGVVICDDPSMRAISDHYELEQIFELMLNAGIDLFCLGNNLVYDPDYIPKSVSALCNLVESGKISESRIQESNERINNLKAKYKING
ncbi:MAG: glycoside hydrolase family 3 N-terminal domain-containing protein [Candidatus Neomarinimicrobiota bacterium]|nr:glycoside hydrolase family 3 N-terminal domain-containing protein [Candidatus Neomarinimicrobiota bacterium]